MPDFSYPFSPGTSDSLTDRVHRVRFLLGDTNVDDPILTDGEIEMALSLASGVVYAAAKCAEAIAARFARRVDVSIGATRVSLSQKAEEYRTLAARLRAMGADEGGSGATLGMRVGGISRDARNAFREDSDRIPPTFELGQDDHDREPVDDRQRERFD